MYLCILLRKAYTMTTKYTVYYVTKIILKLKVVIVLPACLYIYPKVIHYIQ